MYIIIDIINSINLLLIEQSISRLINNKNSTCDACSCGNTEETLRCSHCSLSDTHEHTFILFFNPLAFVSVNSLWLASEK